MGYEEPVLPDALVHKLPNLASDELLSFLPLLQVRNATRGERVERAQERERPKADTFREKDGKERERQRRRAEKGKGEKDWEEKGERCEERRKGKENSGEGEIKRRYI